MYIISGQFGRRRLITPKGMQTRPTASRLREALFNICQQVIEGSAFLDLYAGSGAIGFEALSRGAQSVTFVESHSEALFAIRQNAKELAVEKLCTILPMDVFLGLIRLEKMGRQFDLIYADPPYKMVLEKEGESTFQSLEIIQRIDQSMLLVPEGLLFIEEEAAVVPPNEGLKSLVLKNSRKMGAAGLHQYQRL